MGIQNNFFTAFYSALGDPKNYYSFQKEMITKAMEDLYLNTYRGMSSFEATVIQVNPQSVNTQTQSLAVRVRPIIHDMFIPEPCSKFLTSEKMRKSVISMHPVAYSITAEDNIGDNSGAKEIGQSIQVGNTVVCYFGSGPNNSGQLRGLSFDPSTVKRGSGIDYNCLKGLEQERLGDRFESGQFQPMVTDPISSSSIKFEQDLQRLLESRGLPFHVTSRTRTVEQQMAAIKSKYDNNGRDEVISTYGKNTGTQLVSAIESKDTARFRELASKSSKHLKGNAIDVRTWHYTDEQMSVVLKSIEELIGPGKALVEPIGNCWEKSGRNLKNAKRKQGNKAGEGNCYGEHIHIDVPTDYKKGR